MSKFECLLFFFMHFSCIRPIKWSKPQIAHNQGYSIILGKGPFTTVKIFRGPVTAIKSCKCDMPWIVLTKNITWEYNSRLLHIRGITRGAIPQAPNHCWFAEMSQALPSICTFASGKAQAWTYGGAKFVSYPGHHVTL